jgi:succinyl-CoA synthetase beta subunit
VDLFEYQGKQFFASYGIPVSAGEAVDTVEDAVTAAEKLTYPVVVKAQVQVGGRGKAGGVKLANDVDEVREHASNILGLDIKGHIVKRIWIETASDIAEEYYASFTLACCRPRVAWRSSRSPRPTPTPSPRSGSTRPRACPRRRPGRGSRPPS